MREHASSRAMKLTACGRQSNTAGCAIEKPEANRGLQFADELTNGGCRQIKTLSGFGEALDISYGHERRELSWRESRKGHGPRDASHY
jgi:hypothetical protein